MSDEYSDSDCTDAVDTPPVDVPADVPMDMPADEPGDLPADDVAEDVEPPMESDSADAFTQSEQSDVTVDDPSDAQEDPVDEPVDMPADVPMDVPADMPADVPVDDVVDDVDSPMESDSADAFTQPEQPDIPGDSTPDAQYDQANAPIDAAEDVQGDPEDVPVDAQPEAATDDEPGAITDQAGFSPPVEDVEVPEQTTDSDSPTESESDSVVDTPTEPVETAGPAGDATDPQDEAVAPPEPIADQGSADASETDQAQVIEPEAKDSTPDGVRSRLRDIFAPQGTEEEPAYYEASDGSQFSRTDSGGANFLPKDDFGQEAASYMKKPPEDGAFEVITHGTDDGYAVVDRGNGKEFASPEEFADVIRESGWREGQPIRMAICHAGQPDGMAQQVADILKVPVEASPDSVWVSPNGDIIKGGTGGPLAPLADMKTFNPRS